MSTTARSIERPVPAMDTSGYTLVTIIKTGDVAGHSYRRGSRHNVDAATLAALRSDGLLGDDQTAK